MGYRLSVDEDYDFYVAKNSKGGYEVSLPHQCDDWKITGFDAGDDVKDYSNKHAIVGGQPVEGRYPAHPLDKDFAVKQMELFVKRAQEAMASRELY